MSSFTNPRIVRKSKPNRKFTENTYRKAKPRLLEDFLHRCAYSLQHVDRVGWTIIEVDHHNPTLNGAARNRYENLFPATRHCNGTKSNNWPSKEARRKGVRFLNPCREGDYGTQIFEDANTHELIGITPAAKYHIRVLGLNAPFLINERKERTALMILMQENSRNHLAVKQGGQGSYERASKADRSHDSTNSPHSAWSVGCPDHLGVRSRSRTATASFEQFKLNRQQGVFSCALASSPPLPPAER
jgi:hypothetical protein